MTRLCLHLKIPRSLLHSEPFDTTFVSHRLYFCYQYILQFYLWDLDFLVSIFRHFLRGDGFCPMLSSYFWRPSVVTVFCDDCICPSLYFCHMPIWSVKSHLTRLITFCHISVVISTSVPWSYFICRLRSIPAYITVCFDCTSPSESIQCIARILGSHILSSIQWDVNILHDRLRTSSESISLV